MSLSFVILGVKFLGKFKERPKELFSLLFWNFLFGYLPFSLLGAFLSLYEVITVNFNGEPTYGFKGFIIMLVFTPLMALIFTIVAWVYFRIGNFFLRLFTSLF